MELKATFQGKTVIVTGATSGNGWALAHRLLSLNSRVIGLGRNEQKLTQLKEDGVEAYKLDLADNQAIDTFIRWFAAKNVECNYFFHLAGNAIVGNPTPEQLTLFQASDFIGPIRLMEGMLPYMAQGSTVGAVTSGSVALENIPVLKDYIKIKGQLVNWYIQQRSIFGEHKVNLMLISMGFINTGIWNRPGNGFPRFAAKLVDLTIPGPSRYSDTILQDAATQSPVSYPGLLGNLFKFRDGHYIINPWLRTLFCLSGQLSLSLARSWEVR